MPREGSPSQQAVLRLRINRLQGKQFVHTLHVGETGGTAMKFALQNQPVTQRYAIFLHPHRIGCATFPKASRFSFSSGILSTASTAVSTRANTKAGRASTRPRARRRRLVFFIRPMNWPWRFRPALSRKKLWRSEPCAASNTFAILSGTGLKTKRLCPKENGIFSSSGGRRI